MKKSASVIILTLILVSFLQIRLVKADILIYIKSDGSIVPSTAPIERNGNVYSFTDTIFNQTIIVERSNIVIDGAGFQLKSHRNPSTATAPTERGLYLIEVSNVTLQNIEVQTQTFGIYIENSTACVITNCTLTNEGMQFDAWYMHELNPESPSNCVIANTTNSTLINCSVIDYLGHTGIVLRNCKNNLISNNNIKTYSGAYQVFGIRSKDSSNNTISDNFVAGYWWRGITTGSFDVISGNIVTQSERGLFIGGNGCKVFDNEVNSTIWYPSRGVVADSGTGMQVGGSDSEIFRNTFRNNGLAVVEFGSNNTYYLNNFINNTKTIDFQHSEKSNWDNGTIGNYWDGYQGEDSNSDGIGDTPHIIDENNQDNYPLVNPTGFSKIPETTPLTMSIVSPENKTYSTTNIPLNFTENETVSQITYSLDGQGNVTIDGNTILTDLTDGSHSLIVYATDTIGKTGASETVYFSIEVTSLEPKTSEPVPITWIATATATIAMVGVIILVYLRKKETENNPVKYCTVKLF